MVVTPAQDSTPWRCGPKWRSNARNSRTTERRHDSVGAPQSGEASCLQQVSKTRAPWSTSGLRSDLAKMHLDCQTWSTPVKSTTATERPLASEVADDLHSATMAAKLRRRKSPFAMKSMNGRYYRAARRDAAAACATCVDLRMAETTVAAVFPAPIETISAVYWKTSSRAAINGCTVAEEDALNLPHQLT
jgi:hypothetical protein